MKTIFNGTSDAFPGVPTMSTNAGLTYAGGSAWKGGYYGGNRKVDVPGEKWFPGRWTGFDVTKLREFARAFTDDAWAFDVEPENGYPSSLSSWNDTWKSIEQQLAIIRIFKQERPEIPVGLYNVPMVGAWPSIHKGVVDYWETTAKVPAHLSSMTPAWLASKIPEYKTEWRKYAKEVSILLEWIADDVDFIAPCLYDGGFDEQSTDWIVSATCQLYEIDKPVYPFIWAKNTRYEYSDKTVRIGQMALKQSDGVVLWADEKNPILHGGILGKLR